MGLIIKGTMIDMFLIFTSTIYFKQITPPKCFTAGSPEKDERFLKSDSPFFFEGLYFQVKHIELQGYNMTNPNFLEEISLKISQIFCKMCNSMTPVLPGHCWSHPCPCRCRTCCPASFGPRRKERPSDSEERDEWFFLLGIFRFILDFWRITYTWICLMWKLTNQSSIGEYEYVLLFPINLN